MSDPNQEYLNLLKRSIQDVQKQVQQLKALPDEGESPLKRFWSRDGVHEEKPRSIAEAEAHRTSEASRLRYVRQAQTFSHHMQELEQRLHEEALKIGSHGEAAVKPGAPSRCPRGESAKFTLTELQRAAQRLFYPGCPGPMRRIMTELTPGMGKTCIYMEVIAKFMGKRNPDTGDFFDIVILGDDEVFSAFFNGMGRCPAAVNIEEIIKFNEKVLKGHPDKNDGNLVSEVLFKRNSEEHFPESKHVLLSSINKSTSDKTGRTKRKNKDEQTPATCALNTLLEMQQRSKKLTKPTKVHVAESGSDEESGGEEVKEKTEAEPIEKEDPCEKKKTAIKSPLETIKSPEQCGDDAWIWRGTRVIMIPYAVAAKWVVFSGKGLPLFADKKGDARITKEAVKTTTHTYIELDGERRRFTAKELGQGFGGLLGALGIANSIYRPTGLDFRSSNTLFIIDEVQNISTPSTWGKGHEARPYSPALSEALWRCTGDFCDENLEKKCPEGIQHTPYIFAGTATPNTGTNPESTICLLQILNGRQRAELFVPRWADDGREAAYEELPPRSLEQYRKMLRTGDNRFTKKLVWPPFPERQAKNLVVYPRTFLEAESGFVEDVTSGERSNERFPLLEPQTRKGVVRGWKYDKNKYTYGQAARKVLDEKLLPEDSKDVSKLGAYQQHHVETGGGKLLMHDLAYKSFICAAREEDMRFQFTRIYKPIYSDELNRRFLQDMVASRVFTANSYFDYRVYPELAPSSMQNDLVRPLTRVVVPKYALRCLPRKKGQKGYEPDLDAKVKLVPRLQAEHEFPSAKVQTNSGVQQQYPWYIPGDAPVTFLKNLKRNREKLKECRWSEWSLCADLEEMKILCDELLNGYKNDQHKVDVELEDRLRDFCARNCPKLVVAADDLYNASPHSAADVFLPELSTEAKTFFFMNASNRKVLNSNYFIVLASFYFRMRCRPYVQRQFHGHKEMLPAEYRSGERTVQHRLAWLDALLLKGGSRPKSIKHYPPCNSDDKKTQPDSVQWKDFWSDWMQGHRENRGLQSPTTKSPETTTESPLHKKSPAKPLKSATAEAFRKEQEKRAERAAAAAEELKELEEEPEEDRDPERLRRLEREARKTFFQHFKEEHEKRQTEKRKASRSAYFIPAIFALGDSNMDISEEQTLHQRLYCNFMLKMEKKRDKMPKAWIGDTTKAGHKTKCKSTPLTTEQIVSIMGSSGLRLAMTGAMEKEACARSSSAGQSMVFAGLAAHKALDFKCTGLNVAFGPQPRGQRIQEMGRNWRTCVNLPHVAIRQIFLDGDEDVLKNDLLLDSFYQAQSEVLEWLRTITISAGLGCSLWWGYSQWAKLLSSYHDLRPEETEWFFSKDAKPCLDARGSSGKPSLLTWHQRQEHDAVAGFFRCRRTDVTSVARLHEAGKNVGEIVPSPVGAFSPDEIVFDPEEAHHAVQDPSCRSGSAVDLRTPESASVKYCLSQRQSRLLNLHPKGPPAALRLEHFMGPREEHFHAARKENSRHEESRRAESPLRSSAPPPVPQPSSPQVPKREEMRSTPATQLSPAALSRAVQRTSSAPPSPKSALLKREETHSTPVTQLSTTALSRAVSHTASTPPPPKTTIIPTRSSSMPLPFFKGILHKLSPTPPLQKGILRSSMGRPARPPV
jgi:hypothetical protein